MELFDSMAQILNFTWSGISSINLPGFDFSFGDLIISLLACTLVGWFLGRMFGFGSHNVESINDSGTDVKRR